MLVLNCNFPQHEVVIPDQQGVFQLSFCGHAILCTLRQNVLILLPMEKKGEDIYILQQHENHHGTRHAMHLMEYIDTGESADGAPWTLG